MATPPQAFHVLSSNTWGREGGVQPSVHVAALQCSGTHVRRTCVVIPAIGKSRRAKAWGSLFTWGGMDLMMSCSVTLSSSSAAGAAQTRAEPAVSASASTSSCGIDAAAGPARRQQQPVAAWGAAKHHTLLLALLSVHLNCLKLAPCPQRTLADRAEAKLLGQLGALLVGQVADLGRAGRHRRGRGRGARHHAAASRAGGGSWHGRSRAAQRHRAHAHTRRERANGALQREAAVRGEFGSAYTQPAAGPPPASGIARSAC